MSLDLKSFQNLPAKEQLEVREKLLRNIENSETELNMIEKKLRSAMTDEGTKHSDLGSLLSFRGEVKQVLEHQRRDLAQIDRVLRREEKDRVDVAASVISSGGQNIRPNNAKNTPIPQAKTYQQIVDDLNKEEEAEEIIRLDMILPRLEEFRKLFESKRAEETKRQTQPQTAKNH